MGVSLPFRVRQRKRLQIWGPNWPNCKAQKGIEGKLREEGLVDGGGLGFCFIRKERVLVVVVPFDWVRIYTQIS